MEDDESVILVIEDNGIGIEPSDLDRVFDKSFTGINGRMGRKSTGMGLYLCRKLCKKLGHVISVESSVGEYTKVRISFGKMNFIVTLHRTLQKCKVFVISINGCHKGYFVLCSHNQ